MIRKIIGVIVVCMTGCGFAFGGLLNGNANLVLGQPDFVSISTGTLNTPYVVRVDELKNRILVADTNHHRVLWWSGIANFTNGMIPSGVLGQDGVASSGPNRGGAVAANTLNWPCGIAVDASGNVWVADSGNNRIVRYSGTLTTGMDADVVIGQASTNASDANRGGTGAVGDNTIHTPSGMAFDTSGNLWVADSDNHRVLRFPAPLTTDKAADLVLGQPTMVSTSTYSGNHNSGGDVVGANTLYRPGSVFVEDGGNVWVADHMNHRFLRYSGLISSGMDASLVLGQADFVHGGSNHLDYAEANSIYCAFGMKVDSAGNVWVIDHTNNRVLRYSPPLSNGMDASQVVGQQDFEVVRVNRDGTPGINTLNFPDSIDMDSTGNLWVTDSNNNRVLKFNAASVTSLSPNVWHNGGKKDFIISGQGLVNVTTVKLVKAGQADIIAADVAASTDESRITCTFDLTGVADGLWDLVLSAGNLSTTKAGALTVMAVKASAITPSRATNDGAVDVVITGENFYTGIAPKLSKTGASDIAGSAVAVSSTQVNCRFDILDATTGFWDVVVAPGVTAATLQNAFDIHFPSSVARTILRANSYHLGMETDKTIVTFDITAQTFVQDIFFTAALPRTLSAVNEAHLKPSDVAVEINNDHNLQPQQEMGIGFYYNDSYVAGLNKALLVACYCDEPTGRWIPVNSRANAAGCCVLSRTKHLCVFRLIEMLPSADLTGIRVYPNPYTPRSGDLHDDSALGRGIVFSGLTGRATVKIFTIAGEDVVDLKEDNGDGVLVWDTKNEKGETVASGTYIYLITNADNSVEKKRGKFAVIR